MLSPRRRAREAALQILCAIDADPSLDVEAALQRFFTHLAGADDGEVTLPVADSLDRGFVAALVRGVRAELAAIDRALTEASRSWRLERMALVDRNILRLGLYELLPGHGDTPQRVALNEAIELARRFGSEESTAFVNAILDTALHGGR
jgi:N utilization substance protein B